MSPFSDNNSKRKCTLDIARKIDPRLLNMPDKELQEILDSIYEISQLAWEVYSKENYSSKNPSGLLPF